MAEDLEGPVEAGEEAQPSDIQMRIAEKIRENAREGRLTDVATIESLFTDEDPDVRFDDMAQDPQYADLKWVTTAAGAPLFYSDRHLSPDQAAREGALESAMSSIAEHVRRDSRDRIALTSMETALGLVPEELEGGLDAVLERMAQTPRYEDIKKVVGPTGVEHLHSETHISGSYARILARVAANDPLATMAETIREESRIYPRPTPLDTFRESVFNIDPGELEEHVERMLAAEEYQDIQRVVLSNGAVYLFSTRHLDPRLAARQAEDAEFGDELNP